MTVETDRHPPEEVLTEFALGSSRADIEEHLRGCPCCARYVREMKAVGGYIRSLPDMRVPPGTRREVFRALRKERLKKLRWVSSLTGFLTRGPFVAILAGILAAIFFYFFIVFLL